jgi:hypothetical protein
LNVECLWSDPMLVTEGSMMPACIHVLFQPIFNTIFLI